MSDYWPETKRKLELGRSSLRGKHFEQAEELFLEARAAIADSEGIDSERWGIVTFDLACCASWQDDNALAVRRGMNALRVLIAAEPSGQIALRTDAAMLVGETCENLQRHDDAIRYLEFASAAAAGLTDPVAASSRTDSQLALAYEAAGRDQDAADASMRAWSTVEEERSWLRGRETSAGKRTIGLLRRADRLLDALPVWEWLFVHGFDTEDMWLDIHKSVGRLGEQGHGPEAIEFFYRMELITEQRAKDRRAE